VKRLEIEESSNFLHKDLGKTISKVANTKAPDMYQHFQGGKGYNNLKEEKQDKNMRNFKCN